MILDGKVAALSYKEDLKTKFGKINNPTILVIQVNPDDGSKSYLLGRKKLADYLNVTLLNKVFENPTQEELIEYIKTINNDSSINGVIIDRPLPKYLNEIEIFNELDITKDIDACSEKTQEMGTFVSSTPLATMMLLDYYNVDLSNKNIVIIGRSKNVGKPLRLLIEDRGYQVTVCHSQTIDMPSVTKACDVLFVAMGKKEFIDSTYLNDHQTVIDIGIHYTDDGHIVGDVKKSDLINRETYSPVPGGVGPLTNIALFTNLYKSCKGE